MMTEADMREYANQCGIDHGSVAAPYRPPLTPGICPGADDAYRSGYFAALAYSPLADHT